MSWRVRVGVGIILLLTAISVVGPLTGVFDAYTINPEHILGSPEIAHPFGFDSEGRDVLSRTMVAYRVSFGVAVGAVFLAFLLGALLGVLSGYYRGSVDLLLMRPVDLILAFPAMLFGVSVIAILGRNDFVVAIAISIVFMPLFARLLRSSVLGIASLGYIDAARCRGVSDRGIIVRHVLPNAIGPSIVLASITAGLAIQIEAALSFLGLGAQPPTPSLGVMLAEGREFLTQAPFSEVFPGLVIVLTVAAFLLIGDGLRRRLDPGGLAE
jgi:peptide/nickel transport system permease protein